MNRFFRQLLTPATDSQDDVQYWRERIIAIGLIGAALLGTGAYGVNLVLSIQNQAWLWGIVYTFAYAAIVYIAFNKRLIYNIRAGTLLFFLYIFGVISALQYGSAGDARIWMIGFSILSGLFIGIRAGIGATLLSTTTLLTMGYLMNRRWIAPPAFSEILEPSNLSSWVSTSIPFFALGMLTVLSLGVMLNGLNRSLQRSRQLAQELESDRQHLERRTRQLERREIQVRTAAEISRVISAELNLDRLFQQVANLIKERFDLYYVGVFINDAKGLYTELKAGTGEAGEQMMAAGHKLAIGGTSMVGWAISRRQARIALDVGQDAIRFENPFLPETRSELALPMISASQVIGAMTIQSSRSEAFDQDDIIVLQGVADGLATAIENARLFQQAQSNLQEIQRLHQQYLGEAWLEASNREEDLSYVFENPQAADQEKSLEPAPSLEVPLMLRDQKIGAILLEGGQSAWVDEDRAFVEAITNQAALSLENIRLVAESQRTAQHDRILTDITNKVWATSDVDRILQTALQELGKTLQASDGLIWLDSKQENDNPPEE